MNDREEFIKQYQPDKNYQGNRNNNRRYQPSRDKAQKSKLYPIEYTAPKGSAYKAKQRHKKPKAKLAALLLATAIGIGGISLAINNGNKQSEIPFTEKMEQSSNIGQGLSQETIDKIIKYDEFFANYKDNKEDLDYRDLESISYDIDRLVHFVIEGKIGDILGKDVKDMTIFYDKSVAPNLAYVVAGKENKENTYMYGNSKKENTIPKDVGETILSLSDIKSVQSKLERGEISKNKAVAELEKIFSKIEKLASSEYIIDDKGNISIIYFEKNVEMENQTGQRQTDDERDL